MSIELIPNIIFVETIESVSRDIDGETSRPVPHLDHRLLLRCLSSASALELDPSSKVSLQ